MCNLTITNWRFQRMHRLRDVLGKKINPRNSHNNQKHPIINQQIGIFIAVRSVFQVITRLCHQERSRVQLPMKANYFFSLAIFFHFHLYPYERSQVQLPTKAHSSFFYSFFPLSKLLSVFCQIFHIYNFSLLNDPITFF